MQDASSNPFEKSEDSFDGISMRKNQNGFA
jgi:hypothetical protein